MGIGLGIAGDGGTEMCGLMDVCMNVYPAPGRQYVEIVMLSGRL